MKKIALLLSLLVSNVTYSAEPIIDEVQIESAGETIVFTNSYNFDRCLQYDKLRKKVGKISEKECSGLKNFYERRAAAVEQDKIRREEMHVKYEQEHAERMQAEEKQALDQKQYAEKRRAEEKAATETQEREDAKTEAAYDRADRAAQKKQNAKVAEIKARCGDDYKNPQIGMLLARVKDCVAPVKLVSQINRADGVASLYQSGSLWLNVMQGKVVAWGKN